MKDVKKIEQRIRILEYRREGLIFQLRRDAVPYRADAERRVDKIDEELERLYSSDSD